MEDTAVKQLPPIPENLEIDAALLRKGDFAIDIKANLEPGASSPKVKGEPSRRMGSKPIHPRITRAKSRSLNGAIHTKNAPSLLGLDERVAGEWNPRGGLRRGNSKRKQSHCGGKHHTAPRPSCKASHRRQNTGETDPHVEAMISCLSSLVRESADW